MQSVCWSGSALAHEVSPHYWGELLFAAWEIPRIILTPNLRRMGVGVVAPDLAHYPVHGGRAVLGPLAMNRCVAGPAREGDTGFWTCLFTVQRAIGVSLVAVRDTAGLAGWAWRWWTQRQCTLTPRLAARYLDMGDRARNNESNVSVVLTPRHAEFISAQFRRRAATSRDAGGGHGSKPGRRSRQVPPSRTPDEGVVGRQIEIECQRTGTGRRSVSRYQGPPVAAQAARSEVRTVHTCSACGVETSNLLSSTEGPVCPDCYDEIESEA